MQKENRKRKDGFNVYTYIQIPNMTHKTQKYKFKDYIFHKMA